MNYIKTFLVSLLAAVVVFGGAEALRAPIDLDKLATDAASRVDVPATVKGEKGDRGLTGLQGPKGDKGDPGVNGTNGTNGSNAVFNESAFVAKYGLTAVPVLFTKTINGTGDYNETFTISSSDSYKFTLTKFTGSDLTISVYDKNDVLKFTTTTTTTQTLSVTGDYTVYVEADGNWKVVVEQQ